MKKNIFWGFFLILVIVFGGLIGCSSDLYKDRDFIVVQSFGPNAGKNPTRNVGIGILEMKPELGKVRFLTRPDFNYTVTHNPGKYGNGEYFPARIGDSVYILQFVEIKTDYVSNIYPRGLFLSKGKKTVLCTCNIVKNVGKYTGTKQVEDILLTGMEKIVPASTTDFELGVVDPSVTIPTSFAGMQDLQNFLNRHRLVALITSDDTTKRYISFKSQGSEKTLVDWWYTSEIYINGSKVTIFFFRSHENAGKGLSQIKINDRIFLLSTDIGVVTFIHYSPENQFAKVETLSEIKPTKTAKMLGIVSPAAEQLVETKRLLTGSEPFEELKKYIDKNKLLLVLIEPNLSEKFVPDTGKSIKFWEHKVFRGNRYFYLFSGTPELEFQIGSTRYFWWGEQRILHMSLDELQRLTVSEVASLPTATTSEYPKKDDQVDIMIEDTGTRFSARYGSLATVSGVQQLRIIVNDWVDLQDKAQLIVYFQDKKIHRGAYIGKVTDGTGNKVLIIKITE